MGGHGKQRVTIAKAPGVAIRHGATTARDMVVFMARAVTLAMAAHGSTMARAMVTLTAWHSLSLMACHGKPRGMPCQPKPRIPPGSDPTRP